jgi:dihydrodipicolinate reductase
MAEGILTSVDGIKAQVSDMLKAGREQQTPRFHVDYDILRTRLAEIVASHTVYVNPVDETLGILE